jgi:hypothetical protein
VKKKIYLFSGGNKSDFRSTIMTIDINNENKYKPKEPRSPQLFEFNYAVALRPLNNGRSAPFAKNNIHLIWAPTK